VAETLAGMDAATATVLAVASRGASLG
jgi:hypothetical protein